MRSDGKWATIESSGNAGGGSNIITAVDGTFFLLEDQILGLKDLPTSKIIGLDDNLTNTIKAVDGLFKLVGNKVDKVENARLMTNEEGEKLSSLLGITAVSSDFTFTNGTLGFSADFNKGMTEITTSVGNLNDRVSAIEQSVVWENL